MTLKEKISTYLNNPRERVLGRYNSSEIYAIIANYKKPENHFKPDPIKEEHQEIVLRGMAIEAMLADILKDDCMCGENQGKYELKIDEEITIVVKPDFEWKTEVWETKYPREMVYEIPRKWKYQLECQYRATKKPVKLMVFGEPFNITEIPYTPSDETWEEIIKKIKNYHKRVKEYGKQSN